MALQVHADGNLGRSTMAHVEVFYFQFSLLSKCSQDAVQTTVFEVVVANVEINQVLGIFEDKNHFLGGAAAS